MNVSGFFMKFDRAGYKVDRECAKADRTGCKVDRKRTEVDRGSRKVDRKPTKANQLAGIQANFSS